MNSRIVMGTAQVAGLVTTVVFDPNAEPSESWCVTVGETGVGHGHTPELALDGALRLLGPKDVFLRRIQVTAH